MNRRILFLILLIVLMLPLAAFADNLYAGGDVPDPSAGNDVTIESMMETFLTNVVWPITAGVVIILWIITGILFLTAQGDPTKLNKAKLALVFSIAGTVVVVLAYSAISLVTNSFGLSGSSGTPPDAEDTESFLYHISNLL